MTRKIFLKNLKNNFISKFFAQNFQTFEVIGSQNEI